MKLAVDGATLAEALTIVGGAIPSRAARPVLSNVLLSAHDGILEAMGTDMEVGMRFAIEEVDIEEPGKALLPASRLTGIVKELTGGRIEIRTEDLQTEIRAPGCFFKLVGEDPADFPDIPPAPDGGTEILSATIQVQTRKTAFAAATEETRYAIHGLLWRVGKEGTSEMVATDGKRLARVGDKVTNAEHIALVPVRGMNRILACIEPGEEKIRIAFEERRIIAKAGRATIVMSKIEGTFPNYNEVIPAATSIKIQVDGDHFESCVRRAALLSNQGSEAIMLRFASGKMIASARASNVGEGQIEMEIEFDGEPIEVNFNPKYLLDFCKVRIGEEIEIGMNDARSAVLMLETGGSLQYVVMPVTMESSE